MAKCLIVLISCIAASRGYGLKGNTRNFVSMDGFGGISGVDMNNYGGIYRFCGTNAINGFGGFGGMSGYDIFGRPFGRTDFEGTSFGNFYPRYIGGYQQMLYFYDPAWTRLAGLQSQNFVNFDTLNNNDNRNVGPNSGMANAGVNNAKWSTGLSNGLKNTNLNVGNTGMHSLGNWGGQPSIWNGANRLTEQMSGWDPKVLSNQQSGWNNDILTNNMFDQNMIILKSHKKKK